MSPADSFDPGMTGPEPGSGGGAAAREAACPLAEIYTTALLTRRFEERIIKLAFEGFVPPVLHPGAGQEVGQIAALRALRADDPLLYAHRGVAYMIARGVPLASILADLAGREGGTNNGKGGVMHVVDVGRGVYGESGTLGGGFVIATGMGMGLKKQKRTSVIVHFFGEGASNRGTFHEALNWSAVQKLPILFICENNGWAVSVPASVSTAIDNIADRACAYGIRGATVDGSDPQAVFSLIGEAAEAVRSGTGPMLLEIKAVRLLGHYATDPQDYRHDAAHVLDRDPLIQLQRRLVETGRLDSDGVASLEEAVAREIEQAVEAVRSSPPLDGTLAFSDLYA